MYFIFYIICYFIYIVCLSHILYMWICFAIYSNIATEVLVSNRLDSIHNFACVCPNHLLETAGAS